MRGASCGKRNLVQSWEALFVFYSFARGEMAEPKKRIYLIDGSGYMFRAYYAMMRQRLSNSKGMPTGAVLAFARMLLKVIRDRAPEYAAIAFDRPEPTFRHDIYPAYKANRDAAPEDLVEQIPYMHRVVEVLRIPLLVQPGAEADDIVGTLAARAEAQGYEVVLVTADKDFAQLVSENVRIWDPMKDVEMGPAEIEAKWGVPPERFVDVQALMGDATDNIPGVPGIGEKTAVALIQEFGGLDRLLASTAEIARPAQRRKIEENKEMAELSRRLCTIRRDLDIEGDLEACRLGDADVEAGKTLFGELEFRNIVDQLPGYVASEEEEEESPAEAASPPEARDYHVVRTAAELEAMLAELEEAGRFAFDVETTSLDPMRARIVGLSFSARAERAFYVPVGHEGLETGPQLPLEDVLEAAARLLESPEIEKIGQNVKYDVAVLEEAGRAVRGPLFDTMLASYLLFSARPSHGLDHLAQEFFGITTIKYADLCGKGAKEIPFSMVPVEQATPYACQDADLAFRLAEEMKGRLREAGLTDLFENLEIPLLRVLLAMERTGIRLDADFLREMGKELEARLDAMRSAIHELAGEEFNLNSTPQLRVILFEKLDLPVVKRTKTGPSTDLDTLEKLAPRHPLPQEIVNFRQLSKLKSTYVDTLPRQVHPSTGRIHARFNQTVAATGRLSSSDPNLQNIPIRTDLGRSIRRAFLPAEGWTMLSADYSQIELRVLAHFTNDPALVDAFARGEDVHATTASAVYGAPLDAVDAEMRRVAKAVNFGIIYGQGAFGLSQAIGIPQAEARTFIDTYFERFAAVPAFVEATIEEGRERGYVSTIMGRRRYLPDLNSRNRNAKNAAERTAVNSVIQGSAADVIKLAMIAIAARLESEGLAARMLVQVHDELLFEIPPAEVARVSALVEEEMRGAMGLRVPLEVDVSTGENWGALK